MEDIAKLVESTIIDGPIGDHVREKLVQDMLAELADKAYDDDREWADGVAEWIRDNW